MTTRRLARTPLPGAGASERHDASPIAAAALAGAAAAALSIAVGELMAGLLPGAPSLVVAIGAWVIDHQPAGAKDAVVNAFGTNNKLALNVLIVAVALAIAAALGLVARGRLDVAAVGFGLFGALALLAALQQPLNDPVLAVATAVIATGVGIRTLGWLIRWTEPRPGRVGGGSMPDWNRRGFLIRAAGVAVGSVAVGAAGRRMLET